MVLLQTLLLFPLLALAVPPWPYDVQDGNGHPSAPKNDENPPVVGSNVGNLFLDDPRAAEYHMGMSSDARQPYHQESGPTCGQKYETGEEIYATSTRNVTWPPLLRKTTLGLRAIDTDKSTNVRVSAKTLNNKPDGATIDVSTWSDTKFYWGDASVIAWGGCDSMLESGTLDSYREGLKKKVIFKGCYDVPPVVIAFFYYLDLETNGGGWRARAYAEDVTTSGFSVGASTWSTSKLFSAGVGWIAVPAKSTVHRAGTFSTAELHPWDQPVQKNSKSIEFSSPIRENPVVFAALNAIDMSDKQNMRIELNKTSVSGKGFTWHIDSWSDSKINQASAAYLAY